MNGISIEETELLPLLRALETLKESGYRHQDAQQVWCPDWLITNEKSDLSTESKAQNAKETLKMLKSIKKALATASESLEETLGRVTDQSSDALRIVGFATLPDDVLARIFEINHEAYIAAASSSGATKDHKYVCSSNVLAQVCQRFRRIALHIPSLWEVVSNAHGKDWISIANGRCQKPTVFVAYDVPGAKKSVSNFLKLISPTENWNGLYARFREKGQMHHFVDSISALSRGRFLSLDKLSLRLDWTLSMDDDDSDGGMPFSHSSMPSLSSWNLPRVKELTLANFIPSVINCPALRKCHIEIADMESASGDLRALKAFFGCLTLVESLSILLVNVYMLQPLGRKSKPVKLSRLEKLEVSVQGDTEEEFLGGLMGLIDVTPVKELKVSTCPIDVNEGGNIDEKHEEWLSAIFRSKPSKSSKSGDGVRMFPNVEKFSLELEEGALFFSERDTFRALPRVRDLTLELPRCNNPHLPADLLKGLRSLHYKNCNFFNDDSTLKSLKERGDLKNIEKVEIEGCYNLRRYKDEFKKVLGDRFIWKG
ncbi:hypothetical protein SCHPADRAFT_902676 [Schizopora paradoxa]|uniref:Uncharacterized protein n=1 Tax=Schizopora paradoxa TaxID=27342 RepID=A0A0H2RSW5_9AGAM|nr:hypothetical protein SCHPADRAFT_902676 [Schizopora paradoxa]